VARSGVGDGETETEDGDGGVRNSDVGSRVGAMWDAGGFHDEDASKSYDAKSYKLRKLDVEPA